MTNLEKELQELKEQIIDMMHLVESQLEKSRKAFAKQKGGLAKEIHKLENRVNSMELSINKDCENIIALYNPVASDLRLVLAAHKIITNLERIGDHADKIARYVRKDILKDPYDEKLLAEVEFDLMFNTALEMVNDAIDGFNNEDPEVARGVFEKDLIINNIYKKGADVIAAYQKKNPGDIPDLLCLFSILNKLERVGDLAKNIAVETIFYVEAEVLKHKKNKKRKTPPEPKE